MSNPTVIELQGLEVRFGGRPILKGLNASLSGRCIGLLGPNGAGKTTLLHTLLGFHPASAGTARIFGKDIQTARAGDPRPDGLHARERRLHLRHDRGAVRPADGRALGLPSERSLERAHEALFYVGLGEARYRKVETYSLGMKQLAKLAQALVHGPRLIFLDEPTNGLDPDARERMLRLIHDIRDTGEVNIILSSHLLRDVEECCDEVLVLKGGTIATYCNLEEERRGNRRFLELETRGGDTESFTAAVEALGVEMATAGKTKVKLVLPEGIEVRDLYRLAAERQVQIRHLDYKKDSLQDIFLKAMETEVADHGRV